MTSHLGGKQWEKAKLWIQICSGRSERIVQLLVVASFLIAAWVMFKWQQTYSRAILGVGITLAQVSLKVGYFLVRGTNIPPL